ncbi:MAG: hypothetical protein HYS66_05995 [Deltaproteobacteria bacterium]|nr:hypothetical protein [Deltaproteobacteria bacterium]
MKHSDFQIGTEFFTATGKWRCTDVGMRHDESGERIEERFTSNDPRDLVGPPYLIAEQVFSEYDLEGCYATADEVPL